ncbi:MAG TPA: serine hydrolase, partial [Rhodanobacteraceae bacterium]|nr:serine hydrolase [Rhodanobacteraceae bacterium]
MHSISLRGARIFCAALFSVFIVDASALALPDGFRASIEAGIANGRYRSVAVGLVEGDDHGEWLFGDVDKDGTKPTAQDAYELGSTTRTFTGLLLAKTLLGGKLRLDDTLGRIFDDVHFSDARLAAVTIGELATHRAGLPALPSNLFPRSIDDPYVEYDAAALRAWLAHAKAESVGRYRYSDLGVALIGEAIARVEHRDYRSLVASEVLAPLAMTGSGFGRIPRLVEGWRDGEVVPSWQQQVLSPASGLRATLGDLSKFLAAQLRPDASALRAAILLARDPRAVAGGGETALAWQIVPVESDGQNWPLLWQAGITGGFASFVGLRTDQQRAIVLLGNAGVDLSALGLALLAGHDAPPPPPKVIAMMPPASLAYEGWYRFDGGGDLIVRWSGTGLTAQVSGLLPQAMAAYDDDAFELAGDVSQLTFQRDADRVTGATLHFNGTHLRAARLSEGAPTLKRNTTPSSAAELAPFAGDYAFTSARRAHVVAATPGLRVQLTGTAPVFVRACAVDRFCDVDGTLEVAFARDAKNKVTGLAWRQGVLEAKAA